MKILNRAAHSINLLRMDIEDKLAWYSEKKKLNKPALDAENPLPAKLKALAGILKAEILKPEAPYLKINKTCSIPADLLPNREIHLKMLTKNRLAQNIPIEKCLFFDLETTGLAGGAGTYPFLLGFGFYENNALRVQQFFLPDYGREYHLFKALDAFFRQFSFLVSYNGKSYDYPLLKNRFVLNRLNAEWNHWQHIDLLHLARRVWSESFASCDLGTIEREVLKRERTGDIPGYQIPQAYFDFIRRGVIHEITRIIRHNYFDIISLAELMTRLAEIEKSPSAVSDDTALVRLAALAYEQHDFAYFSSIVEYFTAQQKEIPHQIIRQRGLIYKKQKKWPQALADWQKLITVKAHLFHALEELAKYYEHIRKDYGSALEYTERAISHYRTLSELAPYSVDIQIRKEFSRRRKRLLKKLS